MHQKENNQWMSKQPGMSKSKDRKETLSINRLVGICRKLPDERRHSGNFRHRLTDVLVICLLGMICGYETWEEIWDYARAKRLFLWRTLGIRYGIPSPSTMRRVMGMIEPEALEEVYREWVKPYIGSCLGKQISVDGKTIRGAGRTGECTLHMVSAWIQEDGITMGQLKTEERSNEITAVPALLSFLDIRGGIVSIDAMGCQKAIAKQIIAQEAQYVLAVKANQPTLREEIEEYFAWAQRDSVESHFLQTHAQTEKGHGRITNWKVQICDAGWFEDKEEWPLLHTFICVERTCSRGNGTSQEKAFFISSLHADAKTFHRLIRNHWGIENRLHWSLDVSFHEDACLVHEANAAQNLSLLRKAALAVIRADSSRKASVNRKRKIAAIDDSFALELIGTV